MTNAEKFKEVFGVYATEAWAMPESDFLLWLNGEYNGVERRTSKWNLTEIHNCYETYQCEKCKRTITVFHRYGCSPTRAQVTEDYPYCHCGAKMEVEDADSN